MAGTDRKRLCTVCGAEFTIPAGVPGRPPTRCEDHRRGPDKRPKKSRPTKADKEREHARRRQKNKGKRTQATAEKSLLAAQLAAGLRLLSDPSEAAQFVGLDPSTIDLDELADLARQRHPEVISGDPKGTARILDTAIHLAAVQFLRQLPMIAPRDIPHSTHALGRVREILVGENTRQDWTKIELTLVGADGAEIKVGPDDGD